MHDDDSPREENHRLTIRLEVGPTWFLWIIAGCVIAVTVVLVRQ